MDIHAHRWVWLLVLFVLTPGFLHGKESREFRAEKGVLDLREWRPEAKNTIRLDGEWEFYWEHFLPPQSDDPVSTAAFSGYIAVPGTWHAEPLNGKELPYLGFGTYRLRLLLPPHLPSLTMIVHQLPSANRFFLDGVPIGGQGTVGSSESTSIASYREQHITFEPAGREAVLVVQVSNFQALFGGIRRSLILGDARALSRQATEREVSENILFGVTMFAAALNLLFFLLGWRDKSPLYFGLFCLFMAIRSKLGSHSLDLPFYVHEFSGLWALRFEYLLTISLGPTLASYIQQMYSRFMNPLELRLIGYGEKVLLAVAVLSWVVIPVFRTPETMRLLTLFHLAAVAFAPVVMYVLFQLVRRRSPGIVLFMSAFVVFLVVMLNDILYFHEMVQTGFFLPYGIILFVIMQSLVIARRYADAFGDLERVSRERKRLLEELEAYSATLEEKVEERTRDLTRANESLHEAVTTKNKFFRVIAHDLRGPIGSVKSITEMLDSETPPDPALLTSLKNFSKRTYDLLENLLTWASSQTGQLTAEKRVLDLGTVVPEALMVQKEMAMEKAIALNIDVPQGLLVEADHQMLCTILRNLVGNAIKFTPHRGEIVVTAARNDSRLNIVVKDTGVGMTEEQIEMLFQPGRQSKSTMGTHGETGGGLGLLLSQELAKKNGGQISAESSPGAGATFHLMLPALVPQSS